MAIEYTVADNDTEWSAQFDWACVNLDGDHWVFDFVTNQWIFFDSDAYALYILTWR